MQPISWLFPARLGLAAALLLLVLALTACGAAATPAPARTSAPQPTAPPVPTNPPQATAAPTATIAPQPAAAPTPTTAPKLTAAPTATLPASVTVTDIAGRTVTIKQPVERVILGEARLMYLVASVEGGDPFRRIVGWRSDVRTADLDSYNKYVAKFPYVKDIPEFGTPSAGEFSVEKAIALRPDVFITNQESLARAKEIGVIDQLAKVGVPTVVVDFRRYPLENTVPSTILLGKVLGLQERAQEVVDFYLTEINKVNNRVSDLKGPKPKVLIDRAPGLGAFGDSVCCATFGRANLGLLVERAGGENIGSSLLAGWDGVLNPEQVFVSDPDIIISTGSNWSQQPTSLKEPYFISIGYSATPQQLGKGLQRLVDHRPGWPLLRAVKEGHHYAIWHQFYNSPYHFVAYQQFAKWMYPEVFADLDPEAALKEFHRRFLAIEYSGVFWGAISDR